ncbi:MAG: hypothetical protein K8S13_06435 [Desulfobacula sp.]|uniref:hypothetical protein n=1 Tax=Desulfobacula sp. TaxID=2593537 RepID=UPI0025C62863|nr:hypothetical protein [Desulfobacula sp.]MCD4719482.1 hypothetical protein [Desulfobacula sp.]
MTENTSFLEDLQDDLKQIVQPYQRDLNQKIKKAEFIKQCIRYAGRDDFLKLDELLKSKIAEDIKADEVLESCNPIFESLGKYANEKVKQYRIELVKDLTQLCRDAEIEIRIDFPKFAVLKGINGEINFSNRYTTINKKVLKSIDPRRILTAILKLKRQLYDRPYDPQIFIDSLCQVYLELIENKNSGFGTSIPIQDFYLEYVLSLQAKPFFQNMDKTKFKGYSLDQFSVDIWRYFQAGIGGTSQGYELELSSGRGKTLWLIDSQGESRRITSIAFHKQQE